MEDPTTGTTQSDQHGGPRLPLLTLSQSDSLTGPRLPLLTLSQPDSLTEETQGEREKGRGIIYICFITLLASR